MKLFYSVMIMLSGVGGAYAADAQKENGVDMQFIQLQNKKEAEGQRERALKALQDQMAMRSEVGVNNLHLIQDAVFKRSGVNLSAESIYLAAAQKHYASARTVDDALQDAAKIRTQYIELARNYINQANGGASQKIVFSQPLKPSTSNGYLAQILRKECEAEEKAAQAGQESVCCSWWCWCK